MKTKTIFFILILCNISIFVSAQLAGNTFQLDMEEQGKFNLKFNKGTYELLSPEGTQFVLGDYKVENNVITFMDKEGQMACAPGTVGKYKFKVENRRLILELIEDDCPGRPTMATALWLHVEP